MVASYRLNSIETERLLRGVVKQEWCNLVGDWTAIDGNGNKRLWVARPADGNLNGNAYWQTLEALLGRIMQHYRSQCDYSKLADIRQKKGEGIMEFLSRLTKAFNAHGGIPRPNPYVDDGAYAQNLKTLFLEGMHAGVADQVKMMCLTWRTCPLAEVVRYARHVEQEAQRKKHRRETNGPDNTTVYALQALDSQVQPHTHRSAQTPQPQASQPVGGARPRQFQQGRGRRGGNQQRKRPGKDNPCYVCGKTDHWARDCPNKRTSPAPQ